MERKTPNPESKMLARAIVGGAGMGMPGVDSPPGMGAVLLFVPLDEIAGKSPQDVQADLGLPWASGDEGEGVWFDEM